MTVSGTIFDGHSPLENPMSLLLFQMVLIIVVSNTLGVLLRYVHQPRVVAEVIGGILLGPTALGQIPGYMETVFPLRSLPGLKLIADLGLIFFLFIVGLELDFDAVKGNAKRSVAICVAGTVAPFAMGWLAGYIVYIILSSSVGHVAFGTFGLFFAVSFCITAFPVLARILTEKHLSTSEVGICALSAAAVGDVVAWCLLALPLNNPIAMATVAIANSGAPLTVVYVLLCTSAFAVVMILPVKRLLTMMFLRTAGPEGDITFTTEVVIFLVVLVASFMTEMFGVHAIFGAFLAGLAVPRHHQLPLHLMERIETFISIILLPLYFAYSGLKTDLTLLNTWTIWGLAIMVVVAVSVSKIGSCVAAAKMMGMKWRESMAVGVLMNTKGLVELIVLNIGKDAGIIDNTCFGMLVLMALITTFMTTPLLTWIYRPSREAKEVGMEATLELAAIREALDEPVFKFAVCVPSERDSQKVIRFLTLVMRGREDGSISEDALPAISRITELKPATDYTHGRFSVTSMPDHARPSAVQAVTVNGRGDTHHVEVELDNISQMHFSLNETIQLCALHIASVPDTFSGVTFATKYFRDSPVVKHFHNQCEALGIPSFPYIAVADRDRMGLDHTISESLSIQEGINTLLLCWRWPGAVPYDSLLLNSIPQDQAVTGVLEECSQRICVLVPGTPSVHNDDASTTSTLASNARSTASSRRGPATILVPFFGSKDCRAAAVFAVQLGRVSRRAGLQVHVVNFARTQSTVSSGQSGESNSSTSLDDKAAQPARASAVFKKKTPPAADLRGSQGANVLSVDGPHEVDMDAQRSDLQLKPVLSTARPTPSVSWTLLALLRDLRQPNAGPRGSRVVVTDVDMGGHGADTDPSLDDCVDHFLEMAIGGRGQNDSGAAGIGQPVMIVCGMNAGGVSVSAAHLKEALVIGSLATRLRETDGSLPIVTVRGEKEE